MHYSLLHNQDGASEKPEGSAASETEAVVLARKGDGPAFALIFHRYNAALCSYLARLVGNDEVGRDLAQETFIRAWKSLPGLDGELQFKPWLYRIATNVARSHMRHERLMRWFPWHEQDQQDNPLLNIEGPEINAGEAEQIRHILDQLNPQARICLVLQLSAGFSQREIAAVLTISEKSVSAYVSRGREQFRQLYRQMKGESV
jgi:RNA polymerase sigma-70 factor (ECF subfamily)